MEADDIHDPLLNDEEDNRKEVPTLKDLPKELQEMQPDTSPVIEVSPLSETDQAERHKLIRIISGYRETFEVECHNIPFVPATYSLENLKASLCAHQSAVSDTNTRKTFISFFLMGTVLIEKFGVAAGLNVQSFSTSCRSHPVWLRNAEECAILLSSEYTLDPFTRLGLQTIDMLISLHKVQSSLHNSTYRVKTGKVDESVQRIANSL